MKLLFENWQNFLKEVEQKTKIARPKEEPETDIYASPYKHEYESPREHSRKLYFGKNPDELQCVTDIRHPEVEVFPSDFYRCMENHDYQKLGAGSFRAVFTVPENPELVLKIVGPANSRFSDQKRAMEMNRKEAQASFQTASELVPKVYDSARDYFWIISEKVTPILTWEEMQSFFPVWKAEPEDLFLWWFDKLISSKLNEKAAIENLDNRIEYVKMGKELVNDPLILDIRDLLAQFDLPEWDIRPHNVGYAVRNGKKQFVILDPGFELKKDLFGGEEEQPEESEEFEDFFKDKYAATVVKKPKIEKLSENWRLFVENTEIKGPYDFLYDITTSADKISINLLDITTKEPVESKEEGTDAYISLEKRTDVPHWEVSWSSSPKNSEKVGTDMYLMALELADEGLSPDSYETSPGAERIWAKFMNKNEYGVEKEVKGGHEDKSEENPFNFVFFKPNTTILDKYKDNITRKEVESKEKVGFDPEKEEKYEKYATKTDIWDDLDYIRESLSEYDTNKVSKVVIFDKNGQILLLKRTDDRNDWDLPGGHLKKGESHEEGATREAKEETNLDISGLKHVNNHEHVQFYKCAAPKGEIQLQKEEHTDFKWINPKEIEQYQVRNSLKGAILSAISLVQEDFQQDVKRNHRRLKIRLVGKGGNKYNVGGKMKKPPYKRSKSSPAGFGGS